MQNQDGSIRTPIENDELISLTDLLAPIWRARWFVLIITLAVMIIGVSWAFLNAQYQSQGFFQFGGAIPMVLEKNKETGNDRRRDNDRNRERERERDRDQELAPGIALADFKRYEASYATSERFNDYVQDKKLGSAAGIEDLRKLFYSRLGISQTVQPVYPFTKLDAKVLMEQPKGSSNNVIGLRINYEGRSPETAQQMAGLLGRYAMDSIVYLIYSDVLRFKHDEIQTKITQLDSIIINKKIQLDEYSRKADDLKKIIARNPESAADQGARQVVEITEDSARYLPPATLLTTTEVQASDANAAIIKAKYEQQQNMLLLEYYGRVKEMLDSTKSGETVLRGLEPIKTAVFKDKNLQDDVVKAVYNMITIDNQSAITLYLDRSRFIAGPTLSARSTARPAVALAVSFMLGVLLSIIFVFGREWWRKNRDQLSG